MFTKKKYRLSREAFEILTPIGKTYKLHRVEALIDIPLHGVKAGDVGGFVSHKKILSHEGSCWIADDAMVTSNSSGLTLISGDALVSGKAFVSNRVNGKSKVSGNAIVNASLGGSCDISGNVRIDQADFMGNITMRDNAQFLGGNIYAYGNSRVTISGDVIMDCPTTGYSYDPANLVKFIDVHKDEQIEISGAINLTKVTIKGNCKLDGEFNLQEVNFAGDNTILGKPQIKPNVKFSGKNVIKGDSMIPPGSHVHDVVMDSGILDYSVRGNSIKTARDSSSSSHLSVKSKQTTSKYGMLIEQIEAEYEAYTTDVVKLIKFPAMVDASVPEVGEFLLKLRSAKRVIDTASEEALAEVSEALEMSFVRAENKARTLVASHLDDTKKKSLKTAEKMFTLAFDEAAPDPEKKMGFKAGMRALEGVIDVSDQAVENIKTRIGILELES